eukprot:augustus_masked-scaffold_31-processed-gene-2.64-mRNA-1 protein AED:0.08 eAED:1.00 QI:0/-1/0/1/-1/1/1/0/362
MSTTGPNDLFSIPALFIVFRETLEASIVCSVLLGVLRKVEMTHLNKYVWYGVTVGALFTLGVLAATLIAFSLATERLYDDDVVNGTVDEGLRTETELKLKMGLSFSAAILVAGMCWTLDGILKKQKEIELKVLKETEAEIDKEKVLDWWTVFFLSGTAVAREGVETVIFLGVGSGFEAKSIPISLVVGFIMGTSCGYGLYRAGNNLAIERFFQISTVFLAFIGAGIFAHGIEELYQLRDLGWWGHIVYNISYCCGLRYEGWGLFRALFGYTPYPSRAEMVGYFGYHLVIILGFIIKWKAEKYGWNPYGKCKKSVKTKWAVFTGKEIEKEESLDRSELEEKIAREVQEAKEGGNENSKPNISV